MYERQLIAGWADMDFNSHMRNTAYLDKSADVRMMFFSEHGFPVSEFYRLKIGPVVQKDEIVYMKEANLLDLLRVTLALAGLAPDGSRWILRNEFFRAETKLAVVNSSGGWLDLTARRLVAPPRNLLEMLGRAPRTEDYRELVGLIT